MHVLVLESDRGAADGVIRRLRDAGYAVSRCHDPGLPAFPCKALCADRACPLEGPVAADVCVTVRAHPYPRPTRGEDGAVCALRRRVPLVVTGTSALNPFDDWTAVVADEPDIVGACERAVALPVADLSAAATVDVSLR